MKNDPVCVPQFFVLDVVLWMGELAQMSLKVANMITTVWHRSMAVRHRQRKTGKQKSKPSHEESRTEMIPYRHEKSTMA